MAKKFVYVDTEGFRTESEAFEKVDHVVTSSGAADADKPVVLNSDGKLDSSLFDLGQIDHGALGGLLDDDHTQYLLVSGARPMSGSLDSGGFKIVNVGDGVADTDAVNVRQLQNAINGLDWKDSCRVATTGAIDLTAAPATIDGVTLNSGDRVLVKDQADATQNGLYLFNGSGAAMTRTSDADESSEITSMLTVGVEEGTENANHVYVVTSADPITIGTDPINFGLLPVNSFVGGDGIIITGNEIAVDLLLNGGLKFVGGQLGVEPTDFAGDGLIDDGSDNLAVDWAITFTIDSADAKAFKATDIASTVNGKGASIVGIEDAAAYYAGTDLEAVLIEIKNQLGGTTSSTFNFSEDNVLADNDPIYTALDKLDLKFGDLFSTVVGEGASLIGISDPSNLFTSTNVQGALEELYEMAETSTGDKAISAGAINKGDLLYFSASDTVDKYNATVGNVAVGVALNSTTGAGEEVEYARWDELVEGVLTSATVGHKVYWDGTQLTQTLPPTAGLYVYQVGIAKNSSDMLATVEFVKRNM